MEKELLDVENASIQDCILKWYFLKDTGKHAITCFGIIYDQSIMSQYYCKSLHYFVDTTVKPVYNGHSMEKQKVAVLGRWPLYKGPSSAGHFIYVLSYRMFLFGRYFQKDCYHSISQFFGIIDSELFIITYYFNCLVIKRNNYLLFLPIQINSIWIDMFIIGMHDWPLYTCTWKPIWRGAFIVAADCVRQGSLYRGSL